MGKIILGSSVKGKKLSSFMIVNVVKDMLLFLHYTCIFKESMEKKFLQKHFITIIKCKRRINALF